MADGVPAREAAREADRVPDEPGVVRYEPHDKHSEGDASPTLRRGLPRRAGGDPWSPSRGNAVFIRTVDSTTKTAESEHSEEASIPPESPGPEPRDVVDVSVPLAFHATAGAGAGAPAAPSAPPRRYGPYTAPQWPLILTPIARLFGHVSAR
ncbi:hypothetical protein NQ152_12480 [Microbacterium sp. zg.B48]|uniref:hypothetical protein n=1 Tax=Microbacterium sp. zg.B48 TaxID=2969408 RepID=UPI00214BCA62|nr:hypothetical protein [Microbacterium sp. zg.B48]MCR2764319.1 hypothetical protein [Microbacterium sp. zg.B48]